MDVTISEMNRVDLVTVSGRVDSSTAGELGRKLNDQLDSGSINLVVDLEKVDYMSSAGLRELVAALKRAKKDGGDLRLARPSPRVKEVLDLAGLTTIFEIFDDPVAAVGSF
jgi:anti-sigma B factor antagonist